MYAYICVYCMQIYTYIFINIYTVWIRKIPALSRFQHLLNTMRCWRETSMNWRSSNNWGNVPQTKTLERRVCSSHISKTKLEKKKDALHPQSFNKTFPFSPKQKKSNSLERLPPEFWGTFHLPSSPALVAWYGPLCEWNLAAAFQVHKTRWILDQPTTYSRWFAWFLVRFCRSFCEDVALSYFWPNCWEV